MGEDQDRDGAQGRPPARRARRRRPGQAQRSPSATAGSGGKDAGPRRADAGAATDAGAKAVRRDAAHHTPHAAARRARLAEVRRGVVVPPITYPAELPVSARREEIAAAIRDHQVVIVSGETGSGKTTQLPKILLDLGRGREGQIGHTQPRRIAARTVAERISEEITGGPGALGTIVGYQVRFTDQSSEQTLVKVMTDGILLAQIQRDPKLLAYDTLIIDEAHERSLNIDFILGYLTRLLPQRPDLKVVITSATIDSERFARHFGAPPSDEHPDGVPAPVVEVTGRTYPVEVRYRPLHPDAEGAPDDADDLDDDAWTGEDRDLMTAICEAVDELCAEGPGDILVFLSGEREIRDAEDALRAHLGPRASDLRTPGAVEILPLYARLSSAEQHRVFEPHRTRRVVLATNVAETSLTVPGVRYVVDPGTARISRWSKATKVQRLPIERISQASANQRSGRCGRVADGIAIRLYSRADFESRPEFTEPEILRTSLASVILQMVAVGVATTPDDVARFPFVDPPDVRAVRDGVQLLTELGALAPGPGGKSRLTDVGRALAQLPIDPRLARMIVEAGRRDCAREVMIVAAALSIQDPRERPADQREVADAAHARFADPTSDFLTYLNLWTYLREKQRELSGNAFRRLCRAEFLNYLRVREWQDVVAQLRELAKPLGITVRPPARTGPSTPSPSPSRVRSVPDGHAARVDPKTSARGENSPHEDDEVVLRRDWDAERIHRAILAGLLSQLGMQEVTEVRASATRGKGQTRDQRDHRRPRNEYLGARGARFAIFPGSGLARKPPSWVMAGELVETSRLWARDVARVEPEWAEDLAAHLVKRTYSEPTWSAKQGAAVATERVLLYGLPIVAGRRVLFAKVDPEHARELFIRHALVGGEWTTHHRFWARNRALLEEAEQLEHRTRQRGLVADEDALFDFYDARVPAEVVSARHFDTWWKKAQRERPDLLDLSLELLVGDAEVDESQFPSVWPQGDLELPLVYQYDPGADHDGVMVDIPLSVLPRVRPEGFDRLVPGLQTELVVALVRALPKALRVPLVPAPDAARELVAWIDANEPGWADTVRAADMAPSFATVLSRAARAVRGVEVPDDAWDASRLPPHLRMRFRAVEHRRGAVQVVDEADDLVVLQNRLARRAEDAVRSAVRSAVRDAMREAAAKADDGAVAGSGGPEGAPARPCSAALRMPEPNPGGGSLGPASEDGGTPGSPRRPDGGKGTGKGGGAVSLERPELTGFPEVPGGVVPSVIETVAAGMQVRAWPAFVVGTPLGTGAKVPGARSVSLRVLATQAEQVQAHGAGVRELLLGEVGLATARITTRWTAKESLLLAASPYPTTDALVADLQRAAIDAVAAERGTDLATVRDAGTYAGLRDVLRDALEDRVHAVAREVAQIMDVARELDAELRATTSLALLATVHDIRGQLTGLVHDGFVAEAGPARLPHLVRYLRAARYRLGKAAENITRDEARAWQVDEVVAEWEAAARAARTATPDADRAARLEQARWLLEELRVSLFAQQLGTPVPVSAKRIRALLT